MEISKENIFKVGYTPLLENKKVQKEKWTSRMKRFMFANKILGITFLIFLTFIIANFVLIYNFMRVLENM